MMAYSSKRFCRQTAKAASTQVDESQFCHQWSLGWPLMARRWLNGACKMTDLRALMHFSQCRHTNTHANAHTDADTVSEHLCFVVQKSHSLSSTHTQDEQLTSPQGRSLPKCSAVDKLSLKWNSSANRARQSLGNWLCNQPLLTPFPSGSHTTSDYNC